MSKDKGNLPGISVLVCGGRDYHDGRLVRETLDAIHLERGIMSLVHGGASGADALADEWALRMGVGVTRYPANWDLYGRSAGPVRNRAMLRLEKPQLVVAFPGGRGTADMVRIARETGVEVLEIVR